MRKKKKKKSLMEVSLYEILKVSRGATTEEIKKAYQKLLLLHHPDKGGEGNGESFMLVQAAWDRLKTEEGRRSYEDELAKLKMDVVQEQHVSEVVRADDMNWDEEASVLFMSCRCGGRFEVSQDDVDVGVDIVPCTQCSFRIKVVV